MIKKFQQEQFDGTDADTEDGGLLNSHEGANIESDSPSLNLNSCPPVSNRKNAVSGFEFGPFGTVGILGEDTSHVQKGDKDDATHEHLSVQKRAKDDDDDSELPRKRVCSSNSNSGIAVGVKGNSSPNMEFSVESVKNVCTDEI